MPAKKKARRARAAANDLPRLAGPALRALTVAGVTRLDQLARRTEAELLALHGMGPKAIALLRAALKVQGDSFADPGDR